MIHPTANETILGKSKQSSGATGNPRVTQGDTLGILRILGNPRENLRNPREPEGILGRPKEARRMLGKSCKGFSSGHLRNPETNKRNLNKPESFGETDRHPEKPGASQINFTNLKDMVRNLDKLQDET